MKLTIRDFLWLIFVCALALSWLRSDWKWAAEMRATRDEYNKWQEDFRAESKTLLSDYKRIVSDPVAHDYFLQRRQELDNLRATQFSSTAPTAADKAALP